MDAKDRLVHLSSFAGERADALIALEAEGTKAGWWAKTQERHLRRRTRSYNSYQIPQRHRVERERRAKDGRAEPPNNKRAARRARRSQLEADNSQRWLDSHRWSAKRMRMMTRPDGLVLAASPAGQGPRFVLSQARTGAYVHDRSYVAACLVRPPPGSPMPPGLAAPGPGGIAICPSLAGLAPAQVVAAGDDGSLLVLADSLAIPELADAFGNPAAAESALAMTTFRLRGRLAPRVVGRALAASCAHDDASLAALLSFACASADARGLAVGGALPLELSLSELDKDALQPIPEPSGAAVSWPALTGPAAFAALQRVLAAGRPGDGHSAAPAGRAPALLVRSAARAFDLILPRGVPGVAKRVWQRLIFAGATAAGYHDEQRVLAMEAEPCFPSDFPASSAFKQFWDGVQADFDAAQAARPRSKRLPAPWRVDVAPFHDDVGCSTKDLVLVRVTMDKHQPRGARSRLEVAARLFLPEECGVPEKGHSDDGYPLAQALKPLTTLGFVTSAVGTPQARQTSLRATGNALCHPRVVEWLQESGRAPRKVLVRNFRDDAHKRSRASYALATISLMTTASE